jgi:DNA polymerase (family 10)
MDNISLARLLNETASLLEIDGADPFRIRSYRRAAEAVEQQTTQLATLAGPEGDFKELLSIPGIGKGMATNIRSLVASGSLPLRDELLTKYRSSMLELLRLPGMGPKTVALVWSELQISNIDELEAAARAGHLTTLPRMGEKFIAKLVKGIEDFRRNSSRFRIDVARAHADRIAKLILEFPGIDEVTPAGSLRRGRETVGDLDLLATGPACEADVVAAAVQYVATLPLIDQLMARGQNKVTFTLPNNLQVDVRLLPRASYGAALQYFTGSKHHNVTLRQRALKQGMTLSEYALLRLEDDVIVASRSEEEIYNALGLDYIAPELRENYGEIEAAATHTLPQLIELADLHGDVHMHTSETDGACTIREMAEAALARGRRYIAITDHSKNLAMTNGMNDERALAHAARVRQVNEEMEGRIHLFTGIECDILDEGEMDLEDETLAQLDIVIASVHSRFDQPLDVMTARVLRAIENPYVQILAHPTGRKLLKRDPYAIDLERVMTRAAELGVAVEHNAAPARTDLSDLHLRQAKRLGCRIVINTDAHATAHMDYFKDGIVQLRRAWLTAEDVLNTRTTAGEFLAGLRARP